MKHKKVRILLLCLAVAGVMAGCGAPAGKGEESKTTDSGSKSTAVQEEISAETGKAEKDDSNAKSEGEDKTAQNGSNSETEQATATPEAEAAIAPEEETKDQNSEVKKTDAEPSWKFTAPDLDGNEVTQDILSEKKLTMVNYWATFCGPCLREMPELGELNEEYADKGFQIVGIVTDAYRDNEGDHNVDVAQEVVESTKASYVHLPVTVELLGGPVGNVQAVPTTIFVDENGNQVGEIQIGSKSKDDWAEIIDSYLELV